jgi:hypothetical protein
MVGDPGPPWGSPTMGVKQKEELLVKVAWLVTNNKVKKDFLLRAAMLYAKAKSEARDRRDAWKLRKRLGT